jgi:hypothetical protein
MKILIDRHSTYVEVYSSDTILKFYHSQKIEGVIFMDTYSSYFDIYLSSESIPLLAIIKRNPITNYFLHWTHSKFYPYNYFIHKTEIEHLHNFLYEDISST